MPTPVQPKTDFLPNVFECILSIESQFACSASVLFSHYLDGMGRPIPVWHITVAFGNRGILEPWQYDKRVPVYTKKCSDAWGSLYGALIDVERELDRHPQAKFWRGNR